MKNAEKVPFFSLQEEHAAIKEELLDSFSTLIDQGDFVLGRDLRQFENNFAEFCGVPYAIGVSNGTAALYVALKTLGIGAGDEVILPSATFTSTALAVVQAGGTPVFADIDQHSWTIDVESIREKITKNTKAIIAVHLYGSPCDMDLIVDLAKEKKLFLVEDAAQAHGALYQSKKVGGFGDMACFSFYPSKNLGALGDSGAITFQKSEYIERANAIVNCGKNKSGDHTYMGFNYRMDSIQAAFLNVKLNYLNEKTRRRQEIAEMYKSQIKNAKVQWQLVSKTAPSVYHLFVLKVDDRNHFVQHLLENNIGYSFHYLQAVHLQEAYKHLAYKKGDLPFTEDLYNRCVSIPLFPEMTNDQVNRVIEAVNAY